MVCLEADCALAGVVGLEFLLVGFHGGRTHRIEGTVMLRRPEGDERTPVEAKGWETVAEALLRLRHEGADGLS